MIRECLLSRCAIAAVREISPPYPRPKSRGLAGTIVSEAYELAGHS